MENDVKMYSKCNTIDCMKKQTILKPKDAVAQIRINAWAKTKAEEILAKQGLTLAEAVRIFVNSIVVAEGFPFYRVSTVDGDDVKEYASQILLKAEKKSCEDAALELADEKEKRSKGGRLRVVGLEVASK
ncbi:MAG: type II toxin-antitoxin system RelB/DinJ family antitoxin [Bacilli bacterium]|nr:type II toxin-antitoxin system RelB/DinJ family antitoxin [Bacilli bacterium]